MAANGIKQYSETSSGLRIEVIGLEETIRTLAKYDKEARKQLIDSINKATKMVRDDARKHISGLHIPSGWRKQKGMPQGKGSWKDRELTRNGKGWPPFEIRNFKTGIKSYMRRQKNPSRNVVTARGIVLNRSGEGVIYEFAKQSHKSAAYPWVNSQPFIQKLGAMQGGRIIWAAYERKADEANAIVLDALAVANDKLQAALLRTGGE